MKADRDRTTQPRWHGTGIYWEVVLGLVLAAALVIGLIQNGQAVDVRFLVWTGTLSLAALLLVAAVITVAVTTFSGALWRRSRRRRLTGRAALATTRREELVAATSRRGAPVAPSRQAVSPVPTPGSTDAPQQ